MDIPEADDNIIQQECSFEEAHPLAKIEEIQHTALFYSLPGIWMAATSMAVSSGVAVLIQEAGEETRTKTDLNGTPLRTNGKQHVQTQERTSQIIHLL